MKKREEKRKEIEQLIRKTPTLAINEHPTHIEKIGSLIEQDLEEIRKEHKNLTDDNELKLVEDEISLYRLLLTKGSINQYQQDELTKFFSETDKWLRRAELRLNLKKTTSVDKGKSVDPGATYNENYF